MGNRANVIIKSGSEQVCLYTHWDGSTLPETVRAALIRGKQRWDDFQYLTRIIFCQMVPSSAWDKLTGYGITNQIHDNDNPIITVDVDKQMVEIQYSEPVSFKDYVVAKNDPR